MYTVYTNIAFLGLAISLASCHLGNEKRNPGLALPKDSVFSVPEVPSDSGWIDLSDDSLASHWHSYGSSLPGPAWEERDRTIHLNPSIKSGYQTSGGGDLVSNDSFSEFDLQLEWMIEKKANSGILLFVQDDRSRFAETWHSAPEVQVCDKDSNEDAHSPKHDAGDIYDLVAGRSMAANPAREWNRVEIICVRNRLDIYMNDVHTISTQLWDRHWQELIARSKFREMPGFGSFHTGHLALQDHGEGVWYRHIRVHRLESK